MPNYGNTYVTSRPDPWIRVNAVVFVECRRKMKETIHEMEMSYGTTGSLFR